MTKAEIVREVRRAIYELMADRWEAGMLRLCKIAGVRIPSLEVTSLRRIEIAKVAGPDREFATAALDLGPLCSCGHAAAVHTIGCDACRCPRSAQDILEASRTAA